mmetsp:Transcript_13124/g.15066  ORF Transcript_13124/g.15066 Transcript_13124/m.15066 type:complete len:187 (+) Transcript_13124:10-570(+)
MFIVLSISDKIVLKPEVMGSDPFVSIMKYLHQKYLFKFLKDEGYCVDVLSFKTNDCIVVNGTGDLQHQLDVKLALFRPLKDEIIEGTIVESLPDGLIVSLGFANVLIPAEMLNDPSEYDKKERLWVWKHSKDEVFYDNGKKIRFKFHSFSFDYLESSKIKDCFIIGKTNQPGLGLKSWWESTRKQE